MLCALQRNADSFPTCAMDTRLDGNSNSAVDPVTHPAAAAAAAAALTAAAVGGEHGFAA